MVVQVRHSHTEPVMIVQVRHSHTEPFIVVQVEENRRYRLHKQQMLGKIRISRYLRFRSSMRPVLRRGVYVAIPSTYHPAETGSYLLRMFTRSCAAVFELDDFSTWPTSAFCRCIPFLAAPSLVTRVEVVRLTGLTEDSRGGS
ncbi:hypothetical protein LSAT2_021532 [Lamellibrachia satsuma]|nr:hypothetical protein LSAT2_021532 [Lamellibrachia satsuma]